MQSKTTTWNGESIEPIFLPPAEANSNVLPIIEYFIKLLEEA